MYVQFSDFFGILHQHMRASSKYGGFTGRHPLFRDLFGTYPEIHSYDDTRISKFIHNKCAVPANVRIYYEDTGTAQLGSDIREKILCKLISIEAFASHFYKTIGRDPMLKEILEHSDIGYRLPSELHDLAQYLADVLLIIISREHYPSKNGLEPVFPAWLAEQVDYYLTGRRVPDSSSAFTGRSAELKKLHTLLQNQHEVIMWGIPGIGKSELVYRYCEKHKEDYTNILYLHSSGRLKNDLCTLRILGNPAPTGDMFRDVVQCLRCLREDTLLVIDNLNNMDDQEQERVLALVRQGGCKILITTQCTVPVSDRELHLELDVISDKKSLVKLVEKISGRKDLDKRQVEQVVEKVHRHTTCVILFAILLQTGRHSPGKILRQLNLRNLKDFVKDPIYFAKRHNSYRGHLRTLFGLFELEDEKKEVLQNLTLIPEMGVPLSLFEQWTGTDNFEILYALIRAGLIQTTCCNSANNYAYLISLKPVIREYACDELEPSFRSCEKLIHHTAEAMGLLMDSAEDRYLMEVAREVIQWAKNDDIPVYIDYLHKSFELAARNGRTDDMQTIADALAEILVETDYGNNCDRALMQDYQAQVRDIPSQAIAFRQSAISQLNPDVPDEKKLAAILLDRIANSYMEESNWQMARYYSDLAWSYFRELGMQDQTDIFPAACRRGTILCHTGDGDEGLELLHRLEKFVKISEPLPTQNRVLVLQALSAAYLVTGNFEKSQNYENMANESWQSLANKMNSPI